MPVFFWALAIFGVLILIVAFIFYWREAFRSSSAIQIKINEEISAKRGIDYEKAS